MDKKFEQIYNRLNSFLSLADDVSFLINENIRLNEENKKLREEKDNWYKICMNGEKTRQDMIDSLIGNMIDGKIKICK